jgi:hypothetical protein
MKAGLALLCLLLSAPLGAVDLPFLHAGWALSTSKAAYWRYEMVELQAQPTGLGLAGAEQQPFLEARLFKDGRPVAGMPGREVCLLRFDPNTRSWRGRWPIPWNPELGTYEARLAAPAGPGEGDEHVFFGGPGLTRTVRVMPDQWLASCPVVLRGLKPHTLPKGFGAMTLEPGFTRYRFPGPDGGPRNWQNAFAWARFMEADAFWHCGLQTQVWEGKGQPVTDLPWSQEHMEAVDRFAAEAQRQGMPYGAYMLTFLVGGDFERSQYEFTLSYDRSSDSLVPIRFISMGDARRQRDLVAGLKRLADTPGVSYIGMDYVRANTGGLEFTDEFLSDLDLDLPPGLAQASVEERRLWLGRSLARDDDKTLQHLWDWWRAHKVSLVLKSILDQVKPTQPVWVFSLGWKQGHQHGQDPRMLIDAGISFNSPMFYEADQAQFPVMLEDWQHYLGHTGGVLVFGQVVDTPLLHPRDGLNGPEEFYTRQMETLAQLGPSTDRLGFFWHDLNRAVAGGRGPEGMREWAIAGAASFSQLRQAAGVVPLAVDVSVGGGPAILSGTVRVRNLAPDALGRIHVEGVWTPGLGQVRPRGWWLRDLGPGEFHDLTFSATVTERWVRARYKGGVGLERMLAFKARPLDGDWPRSAWGFQYWKAQPSAASPASPTTAALAGSPTTAAP